jgi:glycine betaine/proline transport system permease protein
MPHVNLGQYAEDVVNWLLKHFGGFFEALSTIGTDVVEAVESVLTAPPALVLIAILVAIPLALRRWGIALFALIAFLLVDSMQLWSQTLETLSMVLVATVVAVAIGVPLGILAARKRPVSMILRVLLDLAQTTPAFVYLIPAVFFFGVGIVPGLMATIVFAIAPAVRLTELGIKGVDEEVVEAARAFGASPRRILRDVQLPLALPSIMAGVNQVIMLALSMVVIAGLTGAEGLGSVVTSAVTQLDIGAGFEGGLAVVVLAVYLDRVTGALAAPRRSRPVRRERRVRVASKEPAGDLTARVATD